VNRKSNLEKEMEVEKSFMTILFSLRRRRRCLPTKSKSISISSAEKSMHIWFFATRVWGSFRELT